jgi:hypothetical protein
MSDSPRLFIASSTEAVEVAEAINIKLESEFRVKLWDNAFGLSSVAITTLINQARDADYGVFVFHKDDETKIKGEIYSSVRDNVLFELGLFVGVLGIDRCFIVVPKSGENPFRIPTDLSGVNVTYYDDSEDDTVDAVAASCAKIKKAIKKSYLAASKPVPDSPVAILEKALNSAQSELWGLRHDLERSKGEAMSLLGAINDHFFSVAKPATPAEIMAWEVGAKESYLKEIKISDYRVYFVDREVVIPALYGASSMAVIVAVGVRVYGVNRLGHNNVYYMDGFRKEGV